MAYFSRFSRGILGALGAAFALFTSPGCDSNVEAQVALAQLAQHCLVNTDCAAPLVCAFEACHAECESSRDCDPGARCVAAARPYKVCQFEKERTCSRSNECVEGLVCGVDGECRDSCLSDSQCVEQQRCVSGTCADTDELDDSGQLPAAPGTTHGAEGSPCVYVSDCSAALLCRNQACLPQCKADKDCSAGELCAETRCVPDGSAKTSCSYSSECETARGERCLAGACRCTCAEDRDCQSGQVCDGCGCRPDPDAPASCAYNSDCANAGEICKEGACACECKVDQDCGKKQKCDGCGCVSAASPVDGVITGSVTIESSLQLALYRGATEITGDLVITNSSIVDLGDTFDKLQTIQGRLSIGQNALLTKIAFPALESVRSLSVQGAGSLILLEFPALKSASVDLGNLGKLTTLDLNALESGYFQLYALSALTKLELPAVTSLQALYVNELPSLVELRLPALRTLLGGLHVQSSGPNALAVLSAPQLASVDVSDLILSNTQLTSLAELGASPWAVKAYGIQVTGNALLSQCLVDAFVTRLTAGGYSGATTTNTNLACPN